MTPYLLLDFGTTSTKSALVDLDTGAFTQPQSHPSIPAVDGRVEQCEIPLLAIRERFLSICRHYYDDLKIPFQGIVICSEMHGFAVLDEDDEPLTHYINWKDGRCLEAIDGATTFDLISEKLGDAFRTVTGMPPRPGFALLNLVHQGRAGKLPARGRVISLPGWLARCSGDARQQDHPTILAAMAFYDVRQKILSAELLDLARQLTGFTPLLDAPVQEGEIAGYWHHQTARIPIHVGVGDHQCSVLGAGLTGDDALSLNLGTGSQVSILDGKVDDPTVETRPYFDGHLLKTITGVPAGRALDAYIGFLDEVAVGQADFWTMLGELAVDDIQQADLDFDLGIFPGSRHYSTGGSITGIREGCFTLGNYLASLLRSFAGQYREIIAILDPGHRLSRCLLGGGIARNLPLLRDLITSDAGYETLPAAPLDESLIGLRTLALIAAGHASTCSAAQSVFGRECSIQH